MKNKAGEFKNMHTRAEWARLTDALKEYEDLLNALIDAAEITF